MPSLVECLSKYMSERTLLGVTLVWSYESELAECLTKAPNEYIGQYWNAAHDCAVNGL